MPQDFVILDVRAWTTVKPGGGVAAGSLVIFKDAAGATHSVYVDKPAPNEAEIIAAIRAGHMMTAPLIGKTVKV